MTRDRGRMIPLMVLLSMVIGPQSLAGPPIGSPYPMPSDGFTPKQTYDIDFATAWKAATAAINENQLPIESASKDTNQITTGYKPGPSDGGLGGGFFGGKLVTQYKYTVYLIPVAAAQTQIKVSAILEARRNAASLGKILSGNNAVSDTRWNDATADNPVVVQGLQNWLYEQIEERVSGAASSENGRSSVIATASPPQAAPSGSSGIEEQLEKLNQLRRKNAITEAEYKAMRAKVLGL